MTHKGVFVILLLACLAFSNVIAQGRPKLPSAMPFGWYSLRLPTKEWPGWVGLGGWSHTEINVLHRELNPDTVIHFSTNRARRWLTSLIEANALTIRQTTTKGLGLYFADVHLYRTYNLSARRVHPRQKYIRNRLISLTLAANAIETFRLTLPYIYTGMNVPNFIRNFSSIFDPSCLLLISKRLER